MYSSHSLKYNYIFRSYDYLYFQILSVLLVAGSAWTNPQNNFFNFNNFATQRPIAPSPTVSTTPVPILRYVDTQNIDGSYTYGYEVGDYVGISILIAARKVQ